MLMKIRLFRLFLMLDVIKTRCYWDVGSTTLAYVRTDTIPRQSFFRWQVLATKSWFFWGGNVDWVDVGWRRELNFVAGLSIGHLPLGVASILNRRTLITSANFLDPYEPRQKEVRIWALGREGLHITPYRYRVLRFRRLILKSNNMEHWHGARGRHSPRHDVSIVHSLDQMYIYNYKPTSYHYAYRTFLPGKHYVLGDTLFLAGSGYEYMEHIYENYKIFYGLLYKVDIVDCSKYLPKWWGKFICLKNRHRYAGVPNGGPLVSSGWLVGIGCFEIRYNEDKILVYTDLRYYFDWVYIYGNLTPGTYYEYAYPQWSVHLGWFWDSYGNRPYIPHWQVKHDMYPFGK